MQGIEPPYTDPYVRWCERSTSQLMASLLLDLVVLDRKMREQNRFGMGYNGELIGLCYNQQTTIYSVCHKNRHYILWFFLNYCFISAKIVYRYLI